MGIIIVLIEKCWCERNDRIYLLVSSKYQLFIMLSQASHRVTICHSGKGLCRSRTELNGKVKEGGILPS